MANVKRPAFRKNDRVTLSRIKRVIPPYDGKPYVLRDTVLTVSHLTGTGSTRNPWHVVVTDGTHFWTLEPGDVTPVETSEAHSMKQQHGSKHELDSWLDHHGYHHARAPKQEHPYAVSSRMAHARKIRQEPTGREVFAAHERDHHITTSGRRALARAQFALPPGPEEKRRGIAGRLPIDTIKRARNALARAAQEHKRGDITAAQLAEAQRAVHRTWPSIGTHTHHAHAHATTRHCYVITVPPTAEVGSYKTKHCGSKTEARKHALWDYNKAREHDGLPPVKRLPAGTKVAKDLSKAV
jgi:hypothetical protein